MIRRCLNDVSPERAYSVARKGIIPRNTKIVSIYLRRRKRGGEPIAFLKPTSDLLKQRLQVSIYQLHLDCHSLALYISLAAETSAKETSPGAMRTMGP